MKYLVIEDLFEVRTDSNSVKLEGTTQLAVLRDHRMMLKLDYSKFLKNVSIVTQGSTWAMKPSSAARSNISAGSLDIHLECRIVNKVSMCSE